ncbi:hypothetical protein PHMEG_00021460 [Phytophthora megakarya]|uniref:Uncharacterized protein n=1 Tax=Phytophthora megakarya TaxID=4795 RepID=A0A225VL59_9STRA|nr:hypothetical protein PHMEG_00021460 [Phytophthora megakarya]
MPAPVPTSASTSVSTPVVDSASVPASAQCVSAVTPAPLSGTTENFSVNKYFELHEKKLELEAKQRAGAAKPDRPRTVFDGSSVLPTDGGIPLDYDMESLKTRAPRLPCHMGPNPRLGLAVPVKTIRTLLRRSVREVLVMQCLPDWKDLPSPRNSVIPRALTTQCANLGCCPSAINGRFGAMVPSNEIPLYVDNRIVDDAEAASKPFEPTTNPSRDYYISLCHEPRYWSSKKASGRSRVPEWQALCQSWNQFVANFNKDPAGYREQIASARERFMRYSITSVVQRVHEGSVNANIPCAVPEGVHCPHCPTGAPRVSERDLLGYTTNRVPAIVKELRANLACTPHRPSPVSEHNTPRKRNTAPRSVTPPVRGGLRTPSPFPERPPSGRFGETTYLEGDPIVSNEYENNRTSVCLRTVMDYNPIHLAVDRTADRVMLLSAVVDAHHMVNTRFTTAFSRSTFAWRLLRAFRLLFQIAELKQQLNLQNAYVTEAAQTTSNIRFEMSEQVRFLREKVERLEDKLRSRRASSSASSAYPQMLQLHLVQTE